MSGIVDWDAGHVRDRLLAVAMLTFTAMWRAEWPVLQHLWAYFFSIGEEQPVLTSPSLLTSVGASLANRVTPSSAECRTRRCTSAATGLENTGKVIRDSVRPRDPSPCVVVTASGAVPEATTDDLGAGGDGVTQVGRGTGNCAGGAEVVLVEHGDGKTQRAEPGRVRGPTSWLRLLVSGGRQPAGRQPSGASTGSPRYG